MLGVWKHAGLPTYRMYGAFLTPDSCTLLNVLEAASKAGLPSMSLDRPNPVTGTHIGRPLLDTSARISLRLLSMARSGTA